METPSTRYSGKATLSDLLFFDKGAMSFLDKEIPRPVQEDILKAATSCTWLGRWKLLIITDKNQQVSSGIHSLTVFTPMRPQQGSALQSRCSPGMPASKS